MAVLSHLSVTLSGGRYVVRVMGRGTFEQSPSFRDFVASCLHQEAFVIVDLQACTYLDSTFLGCLVGLHKIRHHCTPPRLLFHADAAKRLQLFSTSMLDRVLEFTEDCPVAATEFVELAVGQLDERDLGQHIMRCHRRLADLGGPHAEAYRGVADRLAKELGD